MSIVNKLESIGSIIREKLGTTELIPFGEMAAKVRDVYNKGASIAQQKPFVNTSEITTFARFCQDNRFSQEQLNKVNTSKGTSFNSMFYSSDYTDLSEVKFDTSQGTDFRDMFNGCQNLIYAPEFDTSKGKYFNYMFKQCYKLKRLPNISLDSAENISDMCYYCQELPEFINVDTSNITSFGALFYDCQNLKTIPRINFEKSSSNFSSSLFYNCVALENITIEGKIKKNGFSIQYSKLLTHDSLMSIINALDDKTGVSGTWKITLGSTNIAKLAEEELNIAENKGWTVN